MSHDLLPYRSRPDPHKQQQLESEAPMVVESVPPTILHRTYIVKTYRADRLGERIWSCKPCGRKAQTIYHTVISCLGFSSFTSRPLDFVTPTCNSAQCKASALNHANALGNSGDFQGGVQECENCGNVSRRKLCGSCTFAHDGKTAHGMFKKPGRHRFEGDRARMQLIMEAEQAKMDE